MINDGSTDSSPEIALSYQREYKQIRVYNQENQGLSAARNKGLEISKGNYI